MKPVKVLGTTGLHVLVAVPDPRAGRPHMYTLWKLRLGGGSLRPGDDPALGDAWVLGREVDLPLCRRIARRVCVESPVADPGHARDVAARRGVL